MATCRKTLESNVKSLLNAQLELAKEKDKSNRFYRRPAFWIPVACVTFSVGLLVGIGSGYSP